MGLLKINKKKLPAFESSYFRGKNQFLDNDGTQKYFLFQLLFRQFKRTGNNDYALEWKFKGLSDESIKSPFAPANILDPSLDFLDDKTRVKFNRSSLKQVKITHAYKAIVDIYIVYEINKNCNISSYPTLENCLVQLN